MSLLPATPKTAQGNWRLVSRPGEYTHLTFRTDRNRVFLHNAQVSRTDVTLKTLMEEVLGLDGYLITSGYTSPGEMLFKRPARDTLYWLHLRRVVGDEVDGTPFVPIRQASMESVTRSQVTAAQVAGKLVSLVGGIHVPFEGGAVGIFVLRI